MAASKLKVPTAEELEKRAAAEKAGATEGSSGQESASSGTDAGQAPTLPPPPEGDGADAPPEDAPKDPAPTTAAPPVKRRVRVEQVFYWVQGPGLPGVPVPAGSELVLEDGEIEGILRQGAKVLVLDDTLRARLQKLVDELPSDKVDPAHLGEEIAAVEASLAALIAKLKAG